MHAMHYSDDLLTSKRLKGDHAVQPFVTSWLSDEELGKKFYTWLGCLGSNADLDSVPEEFASAPFVAASRILPAWADRKMMERGSAFFIRHADSIMSLLGLLSLPYCYAAADGAMVLYLTERLRDRPAKRLWDTADFIWDVMAPDAFGAQGKGFSSCLKIRLTHALARHYILKGENWRTDWGVPVNQEDMAGTNLAFSLIVIRGLRKLGVSVAYNEQQSFMHLWNVVGYLLGLDEDLLPSEGKSATLLESMIRKRHFKASLQGRALTNALLDHISSTGAVQPSMKEVSKVMRFLLGDEVADILEIPKVVGREYAPTLLKMAASLPRFDGMNIHLAYRERHRAFEKART